MEMYEERLLQPRKAMLPKRLDMMDMKWRLCLALILGTARKQIG